MTHARARHHRWLALLPAILITFGVPWANRVRPFVLGLPFQLFWMLCCVVLTSVVMAIVHALDGRAAPPSPPGDAPRDAPGA